MRGVCVCTCTHVGRRSESFLSRHTTIQTCQRCVSFSLSSPNGGLQTPLESGPCDAGNHSQIQAEAWWGCRGAEWDPLRCRKTVCILNPDSVERRGWKSAPPGFAWPEGRIWAMSQQVSKHLHLSAEIKLKTKLKISGRGKKEGIRFFLVV